MSKIINLSLAGVLALALVSCGTGNTGEQPSGKAPVEKTAKQTTYVTMPENTAISVTLADSIDTDVDVTGGDFRANLNRSIVVNGHTLFADGAGARNAKQGCRVRPPQNTG